MAGFNNSPLRRPEVDGYQTRSAVEKRHSARCFALRGQAAPATG